MHRKFLSPRLVAPGTPQVRHIGLSGGMHHKDGEVKIPKWSLPTFTTPACKACPLDQPSCCR